MKGCLLVMKLILKLLAFIQIRPQTFKETKRQKATNKKILGK